MRKSNAKHEPAKDASSTPAAYLSADERRAAGKALRDVTPRAAHGVGNRLRIGAIRSSFCTRLTKAAFPN
jgi:hypothetical protein